MWINVARVSPEAFEQLQGEPDLIGSLLVDQDAEVLARLGVAEQDISGLDYESAAQMIEAMNEVDEDEIEMDDAGPGAAAADAGDTADTDASDADADTAEAAAADADTAESDEADDAEADPVLVDLRADGELDYDAGFGLAFFLTPGAAKQAAAYSASLGLDDEAKAIVEAAAQRGHFVVGVIS